MQIYSNILESVTHLIGSEIRINDQQNWHDMRCPISYKNKAYKNIEARNL